MEREQQLKDLAVRVSGIAVLSNAIKDSIKELKELYGVEVITTSQNCNYILLYNGIDLVAEAMGAETVDEGTRRSFLHKGTKVMQLAERNSFNFAPANENGKAKYDLVRKEEWYAK